MKAEALGLKVPDAVTSGDSHELLVAWQYMCLSAIIDRRPRVQTLKTLRKLGAKEAGLSAGAVDTALEALWQAGVVHLNDYGTGDLLTDHELDPSDKLTLREDYVPSSKSKLDTALANPGGYADLALGVTYNDYLEFMNSAFIQKATNFVHDHFCVNGLDVETGDGWPVFRIYGDDNMFKKQSWWASPTRERRRTCRTRSCRSSRTAPRLPDTPPRTSSRDCQRR